MWPTPRFDLAAWPSSLSLRVDSGPSGNPRVTASLAVELGNDAARVEARADMFRVDLGQRRSLRVAERAAAAGRSGSRVLEFAQPHRRARRHLAPGFGLDAQRRLNFVLAADNVRLGTRDFGTLDLTSPDAVMDAAGSVVEDIAGELLAGLGDALALARQLLGLCFAGGHPGRHACCIDGRSRWRPSPATGAR